MEWGDLKSVLEIERLSFPNPWPASAFMGEIDNHPISFPFVIVHERSDKVIGYILIWHIKEEAQISNFAVHPDFRRLGIGKAVIQKVLKQFRDVGAKYVLLEVRPSNFSANFLYKKIGFKVLGLKKNYYFNPEEDAIVMGKIL